MPWKFSHPYAVGALAMVTLAAGTIAWRFAFFFAPFAWTGEPQRLAKVLGLRPGMHIADIGAGSGALALALAERVGGMGRLCATELSTERRAEIAQRVDRAGARNVQVIRA